ncbi:MAG: hypothetical protein H0U09_08490 [Geodermatophilaceae bacterium]|nr:hypothetical protein [Geodermatophilaceae bacterium]
MPTWRCTALGAALLLLLPLTGCSSDDGRFDPGGSGEISCMEHQTEEPGTAYTGGENGDTAAVLAVLRYYVSNGAKPYCDGEPPTETDRMWAQLVVDLGGNADSVAPILEAE